MFQLWIQNPNLEFEPVGPPSVAVDGNLWLQVLGKHFGAEVRLRPVEKPAAAHTTERSVWPGELK